MRGKLSLSEMRAVEMSLRTSQAMSHQSQAGAVIRVQLDSEAIEALQLGIDAYSVRASILASKFHKDYKLKPHHITCASQNCLV